MNKALREAKLRSSWLTPNEDYEQHRAARYVARRARSRAAARRSSTASPPSSTRSPPPAMANALTQTALRCLAPGVPDLYRG